MALNSILRRASSSILPLAFRSISASRSFHGSISAAITLGKRELSQELKPGFSLLFPRSYSKKSPEENLVRVLEEEIKCTEEDDLSDGAEIPEGFPFEIQDNPGERTVSLTRKYEDEIIKVEVDIPNVSAEDDENDNDDDDGDDKREESSVPLVVSISKGNGLCLEFGVTAFPDEISIDHLSIKKPDDGSEDQLAYEGPEFHDLDENLQKALHKYLEIRGIKPNTTNFLHEYMINKDSREYSMWLKNLKSFIEK